MTFDKVKMASGEVFQPLDGTLHVRYSKAEDQPKNTLLTLRLEGFIFFGIARCNLGCQDKFSKKAGRAIAAERLKYAISESGRPKINMLVGKSHLWGCCREDREDHLRDHFDDIDRSINSIRKIEYVKWDKKKVKVA